MRSVSVLIVTFSAAPALAGALGDVVGGLKRAAGDDDDKKEGQQTASNDDNKQESDDSDDDSNGYDGSSSGHSSSLHIGLGLDYSQPPPGASGGHVYLYAAGQSVVDSDGSLTLEMRAWYDDFGLGVRQTSFFEKAEPEYLTLDLWTVSGHYRALEDGDNELWIEGGLGGLRTIDDLTMWGAQGAVRAEHAFNPALGVGVEGRMVLLQDNVRASELRASFHASILYLSYRMVDFNVGPPLHGPEVGLGFTF